VTYYGRTPPRRIVQLPDIDQVKEASESWKPSTHEEPTHQLDPRTPHLLMAAEGWDEVAASIDSWLDGVLHATAKT
jgi:hypothetical protein